MKKRLQGLIAGLIVGILLSGGITFAVTRSIEAFYNGITIVVDGNEIVPQDVNGNTVDPFIVNGTTYLPVRAVANALGKAVTWDGPNYTVYIGDMNGTLEYPTLKLEDATNIGGGWLKASVYSLTDNYGNKYATAMSAYYTAQFETLLNMKYSRFRATVYVRQETSSGSTASFNIEADGRIVYSSPEISKTSPPLIVDVDIRGCNDFKIVPNNFNLGGNSVNGDGRLYVWLGDAGFYQ